MNNAELRHVVLQLAERQPGLVNDLIFPVPPDQGYYPPVPTASPNWCVCSRCRQMPTEIERVCCEQQPEHCISRTPVSIYKNLSAEIQL